MLGNQVAINKHDVGETDKKDCNLLFITHCFAVRKSVFFWLVFLLTFPLVVPLDADLDFLLMELEFWMDFIDGISSLLANNFCKLGIAWISMIPIPQNVYF